MINIVQVILVKCL